MRALFYGPFGRCNKLATDWGKGAKTRQKRVLDCSPCTFDSFKLSSSKPVGAAHCTFDVVGRGSDVGRADHYRSQGLRAAGRRIARSELENACPDESFFTQTGMCE